MLSREEPSERVATVVADVDDICAQLTAGVGGSLDFTIESDTESRTVAKLSGLINFILESARHRVEALEEENRRLLRADAVRSDFIANLSHELRTPLTLIAGPLADLMERPDLPDGASAKLELVARSSARLERLVDEVLGLLSADAGRIEIRSQPTDLVPFVSSIVEDFRPLAERSRISLEADLERLDPVLVDPELVEHALLNLLSNAIKYSRESGSVRVKLRRAGGDLVLVVSDDGIGISKGDQAHLFERFQRRGPSVRSPRPGSGLGLALVKEHVGLLGGTIGVESEEGVGTTFTMRFPAETTRAEAVVARAALTAVAREVPRSMTEERPQRGTPTAGPRVLVVDDNPEVQAVIREVLEREYRCSVAPDGRAALDSAVEALVRRGGGRRGDARDGRIRARASDEIQPRPAAHPDHHVDRLRR